MRYDVSLLDTIHAALVDNRQMSSVATCCRYIELTRFRARDVRPRLLRLIVSLSYTPTPVLVLLSHCRNVLRERFEVNFGFLPNGLVMTRGLWK